MRARKPAAATAIVACLVVIPLFTAGFAAPLPGASAAGSAGIAADLSVRPLTTTENSGAATTFDAQQVIGATQKPQPGDFPLKRRRNRMMFWHRFTSWTRSSSPLAWIIAVPLVLLSIIAVPAVLFLRRLRRRKEPDSTGFAGWQEPSAFAPPSSPADDAAATERLRTLSDLHASGALTDAEFETEKRRIIGGG
jgi:hypothetical protein